MIHRGSCHCGKITIEAEGELAQAMQCNCSICSRKGYLLWFVPRANMRWLTPDSELATYTFNKHQIQHHFCPTCGCSPFSEATDRRARPWPPSTCAVWTTMSICPR